MRDLQMSPWDLIAPKTKEAPASSSWVNRKTTVGEPMRTCGTKIKTFFHKPRKKKSFKGRSWLGNRWLIPRR